MNRRDGNFRAGNRHLAFGLSSPISGAVGIHNHPHIVLVIHRDSMGPLLVADHVFADLRNALMAGPNLKSCGPPGSVALKDPERPGIDRPRRERRRARGHCSSVKGKPEGIREVIAHGLLPLHAFQGHLGHRALKRRPSSGRRAECAWSRHRLLRGRSAAQQTPALHFAERLSSFSLRQAIPPGFLSMQYFPSSSLHASSRPPGPPPASEISAESDWCSYVHPGDCAATMPLATTIPTATALLKISVFM